MLENEFSQFKYKKKNKPVNPVYFKKGQVFTNITKGYVYNKETKQLDRDELNDVYIQKDLNDAKSDSPTELFLKQQNGLIEKPDFTLSGDEVAVPERKEFLDEAREHINKANELREKYKLPIGMSVEDVFKESANKAKLIKKKIEKSKQLAKDKKEKEQKDKEALALIEKYKKGVDSSK